MSVPTRDLPEVLRRKGYINGSIIRIKMINFLTYDNCEVFPGPKLNVVIGPNGTGKSSISAAICLALCGSPKLIGRSTDLSTFVNVKSDRPDAYVEVDLLCETSIMTIRRSFSKDSPGSRFQINGVHRTQKDTEKLIKELYISFDNLCAYMPQDRVGEFTMMNAQQLLHETLRVIKAPSVDDEEQTLEDEMQALIGMQSTQFDEANNVRTIQQIVDRMRAEKATMDAEVQRMNDRRAKERKLMLYRKKHTYMNYQRHVDRRTAAATQREELQAQLNEVEASLDPLRVQKRKAEATLQRAMQGSNQTARDFGAASKEAEDALVRSEDADQEASQAVDDMKKLETKRRVAEDRLAHEQQVYLDLTQDLKRLEERKPELEATRAALKDDATKLAAQHRQLEDDVTIPRGEMNRAVAEIRSYDREIANLNDTKAVIRKSLANSNNKLGAQSIKVLEWIEANPARFRGEVRGPVLMELEIPNEFIATIAEKTIPFPTQTAFVVECQEDLELLRREWRENRKFGINFYKINNTTLPNRGISDGTLHLLKEKFGLKGYLNEFLRCPPIIMAQLASFHAVHNIAVSEADTQAVTSEMLGLLVENNTSGTLYNLSAADKVMTSYTIRKSRYNRDGPPSILQGDVARAKHLGTTHDSTARREELIQAKAQQQELEATASRECQRLQKEAREVQEQLRLKNEQIRAVMEQLRNERALTQRIQLQQQKIEDLEATLSRSFEEDVAVHRASLKAAVKKHLKALTTWKEAMRRCCALSIATKSREIEATINSAVFERISAAVAAAELELDDKRSSIVGKEAEIKEIERELGRLTDLLKGDMAPADDDEYTEMMTLPAVDVDDVAQRIENLTQELRGGRENYAILHQYEELTARLVEEEAKLEQAEERVGQARERLQARRDEFMAAVRTLSANLSKLFKAYMEGMGFAGEIKLVDPEALKDWMIQPHVAFRESEELKPLSSQRNSGGERAVSTIMYLMALQDTSRAPVRVVDEINQGMDERNERLVFERIVACTTGNRKPQYFYISPKLLQGLTSMDNDDVTVLLVLNGPGLMAKQQLAFYLKLMMDESNEPDEEGEDALAASNKRGHSDDEDEEFIRAKRQSRANASMSETSSQLKRPADGEASSSRRRRMS